MMRKMKLLGTILLLGILIYSCSTEDSVFEANQIAFLRTGNPDLVEISYEMDYTVLVKEQAGLSSLDMAASSPISEKQKIKMIIRDNGDVRLETEKLQGRNASSIPHETLPNNMPNIVKTVLDGGKMDLFDAQGNLIRSIEGQSISMLEIAKYAKTNLSQLNISKILSCQRKGMSIDELNELILNPSDDVTVTQVGDNVFTIKSPLPPGLYSGDGKETVSIVDTTNKVLLGSRLYGVNDKVLQCIMYRYENCILKGFRQDVRSVLPSGTEVTMQTFADVENFELNYLQ